MQYETLIHVMEQVLYHEVGPGGLDQHSLHQDDLATLGEENMQVSLGAVDMLLHRAAVKLRQRIQSTRPHPVRVVDGVTFHLWLAWAAIDPRGPMQRKHPEGHVSSKPPKSLAAAASNLLRARYVIMPMQVNMIRMHKHYRTCILVQPGMYRAEHSVRNMLIARVCQLCN